MSIIKRKWDFLRKDRRAALIKAVITYFKEEKEKEIGMIEAEEILDFFLETLTPDIYNKAIDDAKNTVKQNYENMEIDLDLLLNK
ncbi:MAG: DUF2164 domain-containing protein [Candidatus Peregrinibacteria bacterium]|nr:DUF2164 domain-containing protein [Candidatus Peregrinibacteria bacterium]